MNPKFSPFTLVEWWYNTITDGTLPDVSVRARSATAQVETEAGISLPDIEGHIDDRVAQLCYEACIGVVPVDLLKEEHVVRQSLLCWHVEFNI